MSIIEKLGVLIEVWRLDVRRQIWLLTTQFGTNCSCICSNNVRKIIYLVPKSLINSTKSDTMIISVPFEKKK